MIARKLWMALIIGLLTWKRKREGKIRWEEALNKRRLIKGARQFAIDFFFTIERKWRLWASGVALFWKIGRLSQLSSWCGLLSFWNFRVKISLCEHRWTSKYESSECWLNCDNIFNRSMWDWCQLTRISKRLPISSIRENLGTFKLFAQSQSRFVVRILFSCSVDHLQSFFY